MALGVGLRIAQYLANRSLWADEVAIALNLRLRSFAGLLHPLSYDQTMPFGLLLVLKAFGSVFGYSEWVLRLPLLLAGCALILLAWFLFARLFEQRVALVFLALLAISEPLIYYAGEVKQYGLDALVTLIILWLGLSTLRNETSAGWPRLIVGGAGTLLFSQPAVFILAGIGAAAVWDDRFRTSRQWRKYVIVAGTLWMIVFGLLYWFSYRNVSYNAFMRAYWEPKFIRVHSSGLRHDVWAALVLLLGQDQILHVSKFLLAALFLAGIAGIARKLGGAFAVLAGLPFLLVLLASALQEYPIVVRLALFLAPILFWIYATSLTTIADLVPEKSSTLVFTILALLFVAPSVPQAWHFQQREGSRDVVRKIEAQNDPEAVYLVFGHYTPWEYYAGDWSHPYRVQERIDLAARCLRTAQLAYALERDNGACSALVFPADDARPKEIVGTPPPGPWDGDSADERWVQQEAHRITGARVPLIWLFLPDEANHFTYGFPQRRKLLERLEAELSREGCRLLERDREGETRAIAMRCSGRS
jgi:Dolichyl-phosphate-mannose-protein mannosyltransferase